MKTNNSSPKDTLSVECCICAGTVNLLSSQAMSIDTPDGVFRVYFHRACFNEQTKDVATKALYKLYEESKTKTP
jgi:hypothetical protein